MDLEDENSEDTEEKLEITEIPQIEVSSSQIVNDTETDIEYSRDKMKSLIDQSCEAINHMMALASDSEHPRAFEVLSNMMKNVGDINGSLMDLHKKKKDFDKTDEVKELPGQTTNNVFIGSTSELQRMLRQQDDEENIVDISDYKKDD